MAPKCESLLKLHHRHSISYSLWLFSFWQTHTFYTSFLFAQNSPRSIKGTLYMFNCTFFTAYSFINDEPVHTRWQIATRILLSPRIACTRLILWLGLRKTTQTSLFKYNPHTNSVYYVCSNMVYIWIDATSIWIICDRNSNHNFKLRMLKNNHTKIIDRFFLHATAGFLDQIACNEFQHTSAYFVYVADC